MSPTQKHKNPLTLKASILLTAILLLCNRGVYAQHELFNDGGWLYVSQSGLLHIEGEVENSTSAKIENDGVIEVAGDLTNNAAASFITGSDSTSTERLVKFTGNGTQAIKGSMSDLSQRSFYNLIIDKVSSGSAVELQTNIAVQGSLVFGSATSGASTYTPTVVSVLTSNAAQGIINTYASGTDYELFVTNPSVNAIKGYAALAIGASPTDGFIQNRGAQGVGIGGLSRNVSVTGTPYVFPVGTVGNNYNASAITFSSLAANPDKVTGMFVDAVGGIGYLGNYCSGCTSGTAAGAGFNYYLSANPCNSNLPQWIVFDALPNDHGYWSFSGNAADQYFIETYPNSFPGLAGNGSDNWRVIKKSGAISSIPTGDWTPEITSDISATSDLLTYTKNTGCFAGAAVPGGLYTGFSHFQMARTETSNALPVELIYLNAQAVQNTFIRLNWATALEVNNAGFEILRSSTGTDFEKIGWVTAKGNGNNTVESDYVFDDLSVAPNTIYYYKLNQLDNNGASKETNLVNVQLTKSDLLTISSCFPNPASEHSNVLISAPVSVKLEFELYDISGQLVTRNEVNVPAGNSDFGFDTSKLSAGLYKTVIRSGDNNFTRTLNIIH